MQISGWFCPNCHAFAKTIQVLAEDDGDCSNCYGAKVVKVLVSEFEKSKKSEYEEGWDDACWTISSAIKNLEKGDQYE